MNRKPSCICLDYGCTPGPCVAPCEHCGQLGQTPDECPYWDRVKGKCPPIEQKDAPKRFAIAGAILAFALAVTWWEKKTR